MRNLHVAVQGDLTLETKMMTIILTAALTAALASPAFSQATPMLNQTPAYASERVQPGLYSGYNGQRGYAQQGYAQQGYAQQGYAPGVVSSGRVIGQDPDRNVQLELNRNPVADY